MHHVVELMSKEHLCVCGEWLLNYLGKSVKQWVKMHIFELRLSIRSNSIYLKWPKCIHNSNDVVKHLMDENRIHEYRIY